MRHGSTLHPFVGPIKSQHSGWYRTVVTSLPVVLATDPFARASFHTPKDTYLPSGISVNHSIYGLSPNGDTAKHKWIRCCPHFVNPLYLPSRAMTRLSVPIRIQLAKLLFCSGQTEWYSYCQFSFRLFASWGQTKQYQMLQKHHKKTKVCLPFNWKILSV